MNKRRKGEEAMAPLFVQLCTAHDSIDNCLQLELQLTTGFISANLISQMFSNISFRGLIVLKKKRSRIVDSD